METFDIVYNQIRIPYLEVVKAVEIETVLDYLTKVENYLVKKTSKGEYKKDVINGGVDVVYYDDRVFEATLLGEFLDGYEIGYEINKIYE